MPLLEKCRDGGGHLGTGWIYIPGAANMTSQYVMYMKIIKYKSSPASGDKHINYKTYSVLFGVSTSLSASLRGSMSFVGPRPLRFLDDLFIDPVPTDCAPCSSTATKNEECLQKHPWNRNSIDMNEAFPRRRYHWIW